MPQTPDTPEEDAGTPKVTEKPHLGTVLVVGGCGFLGQHLVKFLLQEPSCTAIAVMSRSPFTNRLEGVTYHIGDITNPQHVHHVISLVKPKVIINTASPHAYIDHEHAGDNFRVNVDGNRCLLETAGEVGTVKAFVYTSSAPIIAGVGGAYDHADETHPTLAVSGKGDPYHVAKALGDRLTLEANGKNGILTACIRPTALYGEGDSQMVPTVIKVLEDGQTNIWMGYNDIDMDVVYVGHVAKAEVMAALGLLRCHVDPSAPRIDGQAFNITDDEVSRPWTFFRKYWLLAGDKTPLNRVWKIPPPLVMLMAHFAEWFAWAFSAGKSRPQFLKVERMEFVLLTRTYSIKKARELLGFKPWAGQPYSNQEEALKGSVDWYLSPEIHGPAKVPGVSPWPQAPFTLISNTGAKGKAGLPQDHYCITNARIMATTHNTIFRALNAICHQALDIKPGTQDAADFLAYCSVVFEFMHHHHIMEEKHYFPDLSKATGIKDLMSTNIKQHEKLDSLVGKLMRYAETTSKENYNGNDLLIMIEELARPYEMHMHEEIGTILELHGKIGSRELEAIDGKMRGEAEKFSDIFKVAPFFLGNQDRNFSLDDEAPSFPHINFFIPYIVNFILARRHKALWRFNPYTIYGYPRPLPETSHHDNVEEAPMVSPSPLGVGKWSPLNSPTPQSRPSVIKMDQPSAPPPKRKVAEAATDSDADLNTSIKKKPHQSYVEDSDDDDDDDTSSEPESEDDDDDEGDDGEMGLSDEDFGDDGEEDIEEAEDNVEETRHDLPGHPGKVYKLRLFTAKPEEEFLMFGNGNRSKWLLDFHAHIKINGKVIGHTHGRLFNRGFIRHDFWQEMDGVSQDMSDVAHGVFNKFGCLKEELKQHPVRKGTGAWGSELDFDPLLHFEYVSIDREFRRLGLGTTMVKEIIRKVRVNQEDKKNGKDLTEEQKEDRKMREAIFGVPDPKHSQLHCLTLPGWLTRDVESQTEGKSPSQQKEIKARASDNADSFWRSLGFRRIGASSCFAFSLDPQHPSRRLAAADDYQPPEDPLAELFTEEEEAAIKAAFKSHEKRKEISLQRLATALPLHHAAMKQTDAECVETFTKHLGENSAESADWKAVQRGGNNLLHVVASKHKLLTTKWLLENIDNSAKLSEARNLKGYTPTESLNDELEKTRTRAHRGMLLCDVSDQFTGHPMEAVQCLSAILKLPTVSGTTPIPRIIDDHLRLKYGCTCGECMKGFISPRMKEALVYQAECAHYMLLDSADDAETWVGVDLHTEYVPEAIKQNFMTNKSLRQGFATTFNLVTSCLKNDKVPTRKNLIEEYENLSEWPPVTRNYLQAKGTLEGKFEWVLQDVFLMASEQGEMTGDGDYRATMGEKIDKLKTCRNDDEFAMVMVALGLPNPNPTTPFDYIKGMGNVQIPWG